MGYNNEHAAVVPFYLDLETVVNPAAVSCLPPAKAARNIKDPDKIAAAVADKEAQRLAEGALDIDTAQIVAIGYDTTDGEAHTWTAGDTNEVGMLENILGIIAMHQRMYPSSPIVGFNCLAYDLPLIVRRCQMLGVPMGGAALSIARYRHDGIVDLMQVLTFDGLLDRDKTKSLTTYCRLFGLDVPEDDHDGSEIAALVAAGDWEAVRHHCRTDVAKTKALAERIMPGWKR